MMIRICVLALSLLAPHAMAADTGNLRAGRELQLSGFTLFFNSDQFHNALNGCPAQTETFSVDGDIPGISTEVPGLSWDSNTPGFDDGTHAGLKIKKGVHSGIFMDRVSDKKHEVKFKYQGAEGWGAYIDNNPNAPGSGSQVVVMVGTTIVGKLAGNFKGFYGFLSPTPFDEVTIMRDSDATSGQETFTVDNLSIIPWCSIFPGIHGDPHIKTWAGNYFDYMGACDLVLLQSLPLDLALHVRATLRYGYSYIEEAALRIGQDILEVGSYGEHALNQVDFAVDGSGGYELGGYPIYYTQEDKKKYSFDVALSPTANITISVFKDIVNIHMSGTGARGVFVESAGLMGSLDGTLLARDGVTDMGDDYNAFGQEWQVNDDEPMLFRRVRAPQYPAKCVLPEKTAEKRRLGEGISEDAAKLACSKHVAADDFDNCVNDVLAFGDLDMAEAGAF